MPLTYTLMSSSTSEGAGGGVGLDVVVDGSVVNSPTKYHEIQQEVIWKMYDVYFTSCNLLSEARN